MPPAISGIIEGFYGRPWVVEERLLVMRECARWGMTDYVYAPKDDPKHR
ncbi:MAG: beta-N-acetylglucosaminidase domain-containing protein, partial [Acidimicrobiia bacterium]|nr:beta-N-acetylglucosaminidase domain-containing protein [Acidimicrobiia bacterium]